MTVCYGINTVNIVIVVDTITTFDVIGHALIGCWLFGGAKNHRIFNAQCDF